MTALAAEFLRETPTAPPPVAGDSASTDPRAMLLECLHLLQVGDASYRFCLLRETELGESCIDGDDIDLLGSHASIAALLARLQQLALNGMCHFRVTRSNWEKTRLTIFSRDLAHRIDFDLWSNLWQIDRGRRCLRFADVAELTSTSDGITRLRVDIECCIYIHHLASRNKDLSSDSVQSRLAWYEQATLHSPGQVHRIVTEIRRTRCIDPAVLQTTAAALGRNVRGLGRIRQLSRRWKRAAQRLTATAGRRHDARAIALIGCDGCGKTSVAKEIAAQTGGGVELQTGKELYRLSLPFRAVYKFRRSILRISAERLDELLSPLAYVCAIVRLRRRLRRHVASGAPLLVIDRSPVDFLYVRRKTDRPRFSIWSRLLHPLTLNVPVVHFHVSHEVLSQRKEEMNPAGHERFDADMLRKYLSRRYVDYTAFCNDATLDQAVERLHVHLVRHVAVRKAARAAVEHAPTPIGRLVALWNRVQVPIAGAWGGRCFMWAVFAHLIFESIKPTPTAPVLINLAVCGLALQMALYLFSHRKAMKRRRSIASMRAIVVSSVALGLAVLTTVGVMSYLHEYRRMNRMDEIEVFMAACVATWLLATSFDMRVKLLKMTHRSRGWSDTARAATRLLLPIGRFEFHRLLDRIEAARDESDLRQTLAECRVRCDSRYGRAVPWAGARHIIDAYCRLRNSDPAALADRASFQRNETLDDVPVSASLICGLSDVLLDVANSSRVTIRSIASSGGSLTVRITGQARGTICQVDLARQLNAALSPAVLIDRMESENQTTFELTFAPRRLDASFDWNDALAENEHSICASRYSKDAKQSFVRDGQVVRMQRDDVHDSKPTRLEDEYLILRRMSGVSPAFPQVTGCGTMSNGSWLSYRYRKGQPLNDWLSQGSRRRQWFRLIADADHLVRCLRENSVAHRDLNPTNLIVGEDGRLALIDFDQAVADDPRFATADTDGGQRGLVTNDIVKLVDKCGFSGDANEALERLDACWPGDGEHELEFAGHVFAGRVPWYAEWSPIAGAIGNVAGRRVLVVTAGAPLMPVFFASHGAIVHMAPDPQCEALIGELASAANVQVRAASLDKLAPDAFDLVVCVGPEASTPMSRQILDHVAAGQRQVLVEYAGSLAEARRWVHERALVWRGVAGYSPRLHPIIVAASVDSSQWPVVKHL